MPSDGPAREAAHDELWRHETFPRAATALRLGVGVAIALVLANTFLVAGLVVPLRVSGASMAEGLLGPHYRLTCRHCNAPMRWSAESMPQSVTCANCGQRHSDLQRAAVHSGERMLVDRSTFAWRSPRRWEKVVLRCPIDATELCVKRVIGLPGEKIQIRDGDVYVNGKIAAKDFRTQIEMSVPVHDSRYSIGGNAMQESQKARRWRGQNAPSAWRASAAGFVYDVDVAARQKTQSSEIDWLAYHHAQSARGTPTAGAILDDVGYNQAESRMLSPTRDIMLRCRLRAEPRGKLAWHARTVADEFTAEIDLTSGAGKLQHNARPAAGFRADCCARGEWVLAELSLADERFVLLLNGLLVVESPFSRSGSGFRRAPQPSAAPLKIGANGTNVIIDWVEVRRDVYYISPVTGLNPTRWPTYQWLPGAYFVLGDNSAVSVDSRTWPAGAVPSELVVGKPLVW